uniref:F-box domain-containing protein n=1 Tax=Ditylenchus dipsaci TaxID=166011 RepID=A0A915E3E3_9BILA
MQEGFSDGPRFVRPQAMFKTLRRLHGHNLEHQGLNNLNEAFQTFVTRAKFFSLGRLRRTWSHSAVEFMKYRRLLPMLVADESDVGSAFDDFNMNDHRASLSARPVKQEDRRITVMNVLERSKRAKYLRKIEDTPLHIKFKDEQSAEKAKRARPDELTFYGQEMRVLSYLPTGNRRRTTSSQYTTTSDSAVLSSGDQGLSGIAFMTGPPSGANTSENCEGKLSRSSSTASAGTSTSFSLFDELPLKVLERVFRFLEPIDRVRLERVNKSWLEAAAKAWCQCEHLSFSVDDTSATKQFDSRNPLRNSHLTCFLRRCGPHLKSLNLSNTSNLLDDRAVEEIGHQCPHLLELDLSGVSASPNALRSLSESLLLLHKMCYRGMRNSDERHFWSLFKSNAKSIRHVDLRGCVQLRGRCFKLFGGELEEVLLDGCRKIDDEVIEDMCLRFNGLKVLRLDGCDQLTDESISLISRNLSELTNLSLNGDHFPKMTSDNLLNLARLESLRSISFDYNFLVNSELIKALVVGIPDLHSFSIAFAGSDTTVSEEALIEMSKWKRLIEVDISGLAAVNNSVFQSLCNSCLKLEKIVVRNCSYLGDKGVEAIAHNQEGHSLTRIQHIDLSGCILITCKSIQTIVNTFKKSNDEKKAASKMITLIVGGTVCEPNQIRGAAGSNVGHIKSMVHVSFADYSALNFGSIKHYFGPLKLESTEEMTTLTG